MTIEFRDYTKHDYHELLEMVMALYQEDSDGEPMHEAKVAATVKEFTRNPQKLLIQMFVKDNRVIGYSILVYVWSNEYGGNMLNVDELYIKKEYRQQGIGTYFLNRLAKKKEIVALRIETTASNRRAFNYYKRLGFEPSKNDHLIKTK